MTVAAVVVRVGFGVALALVGIAHYIDAATFAEAVGRGLGSLETIGMMWGYLLPGLMIVGGVLIALGFLPPVGALIAGCALVSIPVGLMLKSVLSGMSLNDTMPPTMNAIVWILFYIAAVRGLPSACCGSSCGATPVKATVPSSKPVLIAKAPTKKTATKKK